MQDKYGFPDVMKDAHFYAGWSLVIEDLRAIGNDIDPSATAEIEAWLAGGAERPVLLQNAIKQVQARRAERNA